MNRPTLVAGFGVLATAGSAFAATTGGDDAQVNAAATEPAITIPVLDGHEGAGGAMWNNGFHIMSADEQHHMRIGARLDFDINFDDSDAASLDDGGPENDTIGFRRSRLMLEGTSYGSIGYRAVVDFNGQTAGTEFADLYMTLDNFLVGRLTVGQSFEPFGLEANTYSENISFQERSLLTQLATPGRGVGLKVDDFVEDTNFGWAIGVFSSGGTKGLAGPGAGQLGAAAIPGDATGIGANALEANYAVPGRATFAPMMSEDGSEVLHVGASFTTRGTDTNLALGGGYDDDTRFAVEAAYVTGPLSLQFEYLNAAWSGAGTAADLDVDGVSVQAGYMLTGETRQYSRGSFGGVVPDSEWSGFGGDGTGAWEAAIRWAQTNVERNGVVDAGLDQIDVGINWYLNQHSRFMAGVSIFGGDDNTGGSLGAIQDEDSLNFRWQVII